MASIRQTAEKLKVSESTLKRWEREKLIPNPPRTPGNWRVYRQQDIATIRRFIKERNH